MPMAAPAVSLLAVSRLTESAANGLMRHRWCCCWCTNYCCTQQYKRSSPEIQAQPQLSSSTTGIAAVLQQYASGKPHLCLLFFSLFYCSASAVSAENCSSKRLFLGHHTCRFTAVVRIIAAANYRFNRRRGLNFHSTTSAHS